MLRANVEPAGMGWEPGRAAVAAGSYGFYMAVIIWLVVSNITWLIYGLYIYILFLYGWSCSISGWWFQKFKHFFSFSIYWE